MSKNKAWLIFDYWFDNHGHWMFGVNGKEKAIQSWAGNGIDGLPSYPGDRA